MNFLVLGDLHATPFGEFSRSINQSGDTTLSRSILDTARWVREVYGKSNVSLFINNGDHTSTPGKLDSPTIRLLELIEQEWKSIKRLYNIGNHDLDNKVGLHNLHLHAGYDDLTVVEPNKVTKLDDNVYVVPFTYSIDRQIELLRSIEDGSVVIVHTPIKGVLMTPEIFEEHGVPADEFGRFAFTIASHYHIPQIISKTSHITLSSETSGILPEGSIVVTGTPIPHSFADQNSVYGIWRVESDSRYVEFFENPHAPVYLSRKIQSDSEIKKIKEEISGYGDRRVFLSISAPKNVADKIDQDTFDVQNVRIRREKPKEIEALPNRMKIDDNASLINNIKSYLRKIKSDSVEEISNYLSPFISKLPSDESTSNINFRQLNLRNFMSWGEAEVSFDGSGLVLVQGVNNDTATASSNGSGKTSLLESIIWCLFGNSFRNFDSKDRIIRQGSKGGCSVSLTFDINEETYRVTRTRKSPSTGVTVEKLSDGVWVDISRGSIPATDEQIKQLTGYTFDTFSVITFFGSRFNNQFSMIGDADKKKFLGSVVGIIQYSELRDLVRAEIAPVSRELDSTEAKIEILSKKLLEFEARLVDEELEIENKKAEDLREIDELTKKRRVLISSCSSIDKNIEKIDFDINEIQNKLSAFSSIEAERSRLESELSSSKVLLNRLSSEASRAKSRLFVASDKVKNLDTNCPTCGQLLPQESVDAVKAELMESVDKAAKELTEISANRSDAEAVAKDKENKIQEFDDNHKNDKKLIFGLSSELYSMRSDKKNIEKERQDKNAQAASFLAKIESIKNNDYEKSINNLRKTVESTSDEINVLTEKSLLLAKQKELSSTADRILSPQGIISYVLDSGIGQLNSYLEYISNFIFGGDYVISLESTKELQKGGEENKITIKYSTPAGSYLASSDGERRKADIAVFLAVNFLASGNGKSSNILIADEALDSLDHVASKFVVDAISKFAEEECKRVFLVSHSDNVVSWVPEVMVVERSSGISRIINGNV